MPGFERAATIDRPPSQVYAALDDIHGARNWMPAIRRIEVLTPNDAVDVGFRWRETRAVWGIFRASAEMEIVVHDAPRSWGAKYEDKRIRAMSTVELVPSETGTLVTLREEVEDLQGKPRRAERMAAWIERQDDDLLLRLKAHVESQPVRAGPMELVHEPADSEGVEPAAAKAPRKKAAKKAAKRPAKKTAKKSAKATAKKTTKKGA
jgi:uncharacterized protein YndB with AHSA1/START domain